VFLRIHRFILLCIFAQVYSQISGWPVNAAKRYNRWIERHTLLILKTENPMTITLYDAPKSGHCHRVRLAASVMKIDIELVSVMEMEGQRQGAQYLAIDPLGQIPTIKDGDFILRDSIAIIQYLAENYAADKGWMPSGIQERARLNE